MRLVLIGPPGAGKGTQAKCIVDRYNLAMVSTGDMLRAAIARGDELGQLIETIVVTGHLVSDSIVMRLVQHCLQQHSEASGFLFDGFPRTIEQAQMLEQYNIAPTIVINLIVADDILVDRIAGRLVHSASGRIYHKKYSPPQKEGVDDVTGEALITRNDDSLETVIKRLAVYHARTEPLLNFYYTVSGIHVHDIDAVGPVDVVSHKLYMVLEKHLLALSK